VLLLKDQLIGIQGQFLNGLAYFICSQSLLELFWMLALVEFLLDHFQGLLLGEAAFLLVCNCV